MRRAQLPPAREVFDGHGLLIEVAYGCGKASPSAAIPSQSCARRDGVAAVDPSNITLNQIE